MIIVSVGADDVQWSIMTQLCVASTVCNDKVSNAYFNQLISDFTRSYYELLGDLAALPGAPAVLINQYYSPFGPDLSCLSKYGITPAKEKVLASRLAQLNTVLAQGAQTFGFGVTEPQFTGHELCIAEPLRPGPGRPGAAAPDRGRRAGHRAGRPAGPAEGRGPGPGADSVPERQRVSGGQE